MRLLLIEDDLLLGKMTQLGLAQLGCRVDWVRTGGLGLEAARQQVHEAILLDLGLPDISGIDLLGKLRSEEIATPVIIITAREEIEDRIMGLDSGADDFVTKPFSLEELAARLRATVRRFAGRSIESIVIGRLQIRPVSREVFHDGKQVVLTHREFELIRKLMESAGKTLSAEQLQGAIYGWGEEIGSNSVQVHIHNLRKKLGRTAIQTIHGIGYRIGPDA